MFNRRGLLIAAPCGLGVAALSSLGLAQSEDTPLRGDQLRSALHRADASLFPSSALGLLGAVLSGLVGFVLGKNPLALLEGPAGQTVVGGVEPAADRYVASREGVFGSVPALQNASLGDQRADYHKLTPFVGGIDDAHGELQEPLDKILDTLKRFSENRTSADLSTNEVDALKSVQNVVINISGDHRALCGYTDKHRDVSPVYGAIAQHAGISRDERFLRYYEMHKDRADRQTQALLSTSDKLGDSLRILDNALPVSRPNG